MILLSLEFFKIRRKKIGVMIVFFLLVEMMLAFITTSISIANHPDQAVWESIIFNIVTMNGLFMPILSAVVVSRICDMEHKGGDLENACCYQCEPCTSLCSEIYMRQ